MAKSKVKVLNVKNVAVAVLLVVFIVGVGMFFIKYTPSLSQSQAAGRAVSDRAACRDKDASLRCRAANLDLPVQTRNCRQDTKSGRTACSNRDGDRNTIATFCGC